MRRIIIDLPDEAAGVEALAMREKKPGWWKTLGTAGVGGLRVDRHYQYDPENGWQEIGKFYRPEDKAAE